MINRRDSKMVDKLSMENRERRMIGVFEFWNWKVEIINFEVRYGKLRGKENEVKKF